MNKERLVNTFLDLVRIPSPSRNERRVADYILNFCNAMALMLEILSQAGARRIKNV